MKISEKWLRSFVKINRPIQEIAEILTLRGLEVEEIAPVAAKLDCIVVAEIISTAKHPNADKLAVCQVNNGQEILTVVCGAPNARAGLKVALAQIGAVLPGVTIKKSKIRDVESCGMLCSVSELGLADKSEGIMELPHDAPVGTTLTQYLDLDDNVLDISITPNRGDCASVLGIAREIAAIEGGSLILNDEKKVAAEKLSPLSLKINNTALDACPKYLARTITGMNPNAQTPVWMKERLRRSSIKSIAVSVDVTNYVMLALGQPMHAFDLQKIAGDVAIRAANQHEKIELLNDVSIELHNNALVIADQQGAIALAGIMGGSRTAVSATTSDVLLESAHFSPQIVAAMARYYNLQSDSSYRFERGVDIALPQRAIELATQLIIDIAGGTPSSINIQSDQAVTSTPIFLRYKKLEKVIGVFIAPAEIKKCFADLHMSVEEVAEGLLVTAPSYRFDIKIEEDLIEEVLRIHGCDAIEAIAPRPVLSLQSSITAKVNVDAERMLLKTFGYDEIISYSFVDEKLQAQLFPGQTAIKLKNPMSQEMAAMRTTLWTGLVATLLYNLRRQQVRVRLFEEGLCFFENGDQLKKLSGLSYGGVYPESWGNLKETSHFFDIKNEVVALLAENNLADDYVFIASRHPALHPTQSAQLVHKQSRAILGNIGVLHPQLVQELDLPMAPVLFELDVKTLRVDKAHKTVVPLSKFPEVRRDLSFLMPASAAYQDVVDTVLAVDKENRVRNVSVFDVYQGKGVPEGQKSIAIKLMIQDFHKTMTDDEVASLIKKVIDLVEEKFNATLRG